MEPKLFLATKAFIDYRGRVLVVRESAHYQDGTQTGKYDVPGGRLRAGERFDENLAREIKEETGLAVNIGNPFFVNESWPLVRGEQWQIVRVFFRCKGAGGEVRVGTDHDTFLWINPKDYRGYPLVENLFPAFEAYLKTL